MLGTIVFGLVAPVLAHSPAEHACHYRPPGTWVAEVEAAVARGEIADPTARRLPAVAPRTALAGVNPTPCLSTLHVFPFEDTAQVLLTNFSDGQLLNLMADGANALMAAHGDNFDFIGYWLNFVPDHTIGSAFYMPIENDVSGIGDPSTVGTPIFNNRVSLGVDGDNVEGYIMMWNINSGQWAPATGPDAFFTRIALGQELAQPRPSPITRRRSRSVKMPTSLPAEQTAALPWLWLRISAAASATVSVVSRVGRVVSANSPTVVDVKILRRSN